MDGRRNCRNKAPFSRRISVDGRPNRRNKAAFLNFTVDGNNTVTKEMYKTLSCLSIFTVNRSCSID